jgi:hypothetical protein
MEFIFEFRFPEGELETELETELEREYASRVLVWSSRGFALGIPNSMYACPKDLPNNACKANFIQLFYTFGRGRKQTTTPKASYVFFLAAEPRIQTS